jgi:hypothetical protein
MRPPNDTESDYKVKVILLKSEDYTVAISLFREGAATERVLIS